MAAPGHNQTFCGPRNDDNLPALSGRLRLGWGLHEAARPPPAVPDEFRAVPDRMIDYLGMGGSSTKIVIRQTS